jgi:D-tyrosyl-tRNA(Tyr) deacylase
LINLKRMRAVVQRVKRASVVINGSVHAAIQSGLMILVGIEDSDGVQDVQWLSNKLVNLRIFKDAAGVMNRSLAETGGDVLLVSQFTLLAATKKGNRPSYIRASRPDIAIPLYETMIGQLEKDLGKKIYTGRFGADMQVDILNDGPVTLFIDTKQKDL